MKKTLKWIGIVAAVLVVLALIAVPVVMRISGLGGIGPGPGMRAWNGAAPRTQNFQQPQEPQQRQQRNFGGTQERGFQPMPHNYRGGFSMMGFGMGLVGMALRALWNLLLLGLVIAGVIFVVQTLRRPRSAPQSAAASVPAPAAVVEPLASSPAQTCASCGRELQSGWTHCPHCGAQI